MSSRETTNDKINEVSNLSLQTRRGIYLRNETDPRLRCKIVDGKWPLTAPKKNIAKPPNWTKPSKGGNLQLLQSDSSDDSPTSLGESNFKDTQTNLNATDTADVTMLQIWGTDFRKCQ